MGETNTLTNQDSASKQDQTSGGNSGSTSQTVKTFTEKELSDRLAEQGRKYSGTIKSLQEQINSIQAERDRVEEEKVKDDPDKASIFKTRKELRDEAHRLQKVQEELEAQKAELQEDLRLASETKASRVIEDVASGFENLDKSKLKVLCAKANATTKEAITEIAELIGTRKTESHDTFNKPDSGDSSGGSPDTFTKAQISKMTPQEYQKNFDKIQTAYRNGKIR